MSRESRLGPHLSSPEALAIVQQHTQVTAHPRRQSSLFPAPPRRSWVVPGDNRVVFNSYFFPGRPSYLSLSVIFWETSRLITFLSLTTGFLCLSHLPVSQQEWIPFTSSLLHMQSVTRFHEFFLFHLYRLSILVLLTVFHLTPVQALISGPLCPWVSGMAHQLLIYSRPASDPLFWWLLLKEAQREFYETPEALETFTNSCSLPFASLSLSSPPCPCWQSN